METLEIAQVLSRGEDSQNQFKKNLNNVDALASELIAFSNSSGGKIFVGVDDNGIVTGLERNDISRINQLLSNAASQSVKPSINPLTEIATINDAKIMIIDVPEGINRPYQDKNGVIWVKVGSDKRRATSREEIQRIFQSSGLIHADVMPANGITISNLDMLYFRSFFQKTYDESLENQQVPLEQTIYNLNLGRNGELNLTGAMLFAQNPSFRLPVYIVKVAAFPGDDIATESYIDSQDITGKLSDIFQQTISFIMSKTRKQGEQGINSSGEPEVPRIVFEELVANALIHRDYFISAPIRIFVFSNRIEIISPGHLPNNLTIDNIKFGISNVRNPTLTSFATRLLPYRGLGSGIMRALKVYPDIEFIDDREGNLFHCIIKRLPSQGADCGRDS